MQGHFGRWEALSDWPESTLMPLAGLDSID